MKVRLKTTATVGLQPDALAGWRPAGAEVEIEDDHFDAELHEIIDETTDLPVVPEVNPLPEGPGSGESQAQQQPWKKKKKWEPGDK